MEITGSTAVLVINQQHPFYAEVYERLLDSEDPNAVEALDLLLYGFVRMQDERYSQQSYVIDSARGVLLPCAKGVVCT